MLKLEFEMPESIAAYAMYGDGCGDEIEAAYDKWLSDTMAHEKLKSMHLIDVSDNASFMAYHELKDYGIGSADCLTFVYDVRRL